MRLLRAITTASLFLSGACVGELELPDRVGGADAGTDVDPSEPDAGTTPPPDGGIVPPDAEPTSIVWKAVLMTGDDSISAFDNAREQVKLLFEADGILDQNTIQLSRDASEQVGGVRATSVSGLETAMLDLDVGPGDGCAVFMTSHGSQQGFYIRDSNTLTPNTLDQILDDACGDQPTVVMISACYSGVFVDPLQGPNRIILTAARSDRTSFGCSAEATYTYWDGCLIDKFQTVDTWSELYDTVTDCIELKEGSGSFTPSLPQGSFGADVRDMSIFDRQ